MESCPLYKVLDIITELGLVQTSGIVRISGMNLVILFHENKH